MSVKFVMEPPETRTPGLCVAVLVVCGLGYVCLLVECFHRILSVFA